MTCIINGFATKKALKTAVQEGENVFIIDPSFFAPREFFASNLNEGEEIVATNHPKRSWFAQIGKKGGKVYVK